MALHIDMLASHQLGRDMSLAWAPSLTFSNYRLGSMHVDFIGFEAFMILDHGDLVNIS